VPFFRSYHPATYPSRLGPVVDCYWPLVVLQPTFVANPSIVFTREKPAKWLQTPPREQSASQPAKHAAKQSRRDKPFRLPDKANFNLTYSPGTESWTGTAVEVVCEGADAGELPGNKEEPKSPGKIPFARSLPLEKACKPEVLLAYKMNGASAAEAGQRRFHGARKDQRSVDDYGVSARTPTGCNDSGFKRHNATRASTTAW
jgi:Oxidoreductase molybdopterin binding domain